MKLEDLVPSYTLCEMIPRGEFGDSAFVWLKRRKKHIAVRKPYMGQSVPAPTLAEILQKLEIEACKSVFWGYSEAREFRGDHPLGEVVSFALETWFMQEEEKEK